jgi:hypothetical protein
MELSSVSVEMAVRRALESDGGEPVHEVRRITLIASAPGDLPGYEATRSRLLREGADAWRSSVAAAAFRLEFVTLQVEYTRTHH